MKTRTDNAGDGFSRRGLFAHMPALAAAAFLGLPWRAGAQTPPETRKIRLYRAPTTCFAPQYLAEELLLLEGFSDVEYVEPESTATIAEELFDIGMKTAPYVVPVLCPARHLRPACDQRNARATRCCCGLL